jgi:hypothetical protein
MKTVKNLSHGSWYHDWDLNRIPCEWKSRLLTSSIICSVKEKLIRNHRHRTIVDTFRLRNTSVHLLWCIPKSFFFFRGVL